MSRVSTRTRLKASQREAQLLDIAEELFTDNGYEGASIEDIARVAGVTRPVVYQRFGSKEGVFIACVDRARQQFEADLTAGVSGAAGDLEAAIEAGARSFYKVLATNPRRWALLFATSSSMDGPLSEQLSDLRARTVAQIVEVARPYAPDTAQTDLEALAHAMSGIGEQLGRWWIRNPELSMDDVVEQYVLLVTACAVATLSRA